MAKNVTMDMIAKELKISKSLVSRALSDRYGVSDETRSMIKLGALEMGYKFLYKHKRAMAKTESLTLLVKRHDLLDSGFWVKIINGIEKELNRKNISVFLSVIENDNDILPISVKQMKTNGVLVLGAIPLKHIASIATSGLPVVLVDPHDSNLKFDTVVANNYHGAYEATEYLLQNGHVRIAFVGSIDYSFSFKERHRGFIDRMSLHKGIGCVPVSIIENFDDFRIPFSKEFFLKHMASEERSTAILCGNDLTAMLVYDMLSELGLRIPQDVSVMGFDNIEKAEWVTPPLTTVNIPKTTMGEKSVELLLKRIEQPERNFEMDMIGTNIVKRSSVARIHK